MKIKDWLYSQLVDGRYGKLLSWVDEEKRTIGIRWKHASYGDYDADESALFRAWAQKNNRIDAQEVESKEAKRWKTNFRCALHSATDVNFLGSFKKDKVLYRHYKLLSTPDPTKVDKKRISNKKASETKKKPKSDRRQYISRKSNLVKSCQQLQNSIHIPADSAVTDKIEDGSEPVRKSLSLFFSNSDIRPSLIESYDEEFCDCGYISDLSSQGDYTSDNSNEHELFSSNDFLEYKDADDVDDTCAPHQHSYFMEQFCDSYKVVEVVNGPNVTVEQLSYCCL